MKIIEILTLCILLFFTSINLQAQDEKLLHMGGHIHLKNAFLMYEDPSLANGENAFNYSFGFDMYYAVSSRIELRVGVNYSTMRVDQIDYSPLLGCDYTGSGSADLYSSYIQDRYRVQYIGIPINGKLKLFGAENHVYAVVGGEVLFGIAYKRDLTLISCGSTGGGISSSNQGQNLNATIFKIMGGIGGEMAVTKNMKFFVEPRLDYTLNHFLKANSIGSEPTNNVKSLELGMMVGLIF